MCTVFIGNHILGAGTVLLGANRDENPARPSDAPALLGEHPRLVGGRDRISGGTWLAIRERRAAIAILNRRDGETASGVTLRSRGLLALEVAGVRSGAKEVSLSRAASDRAVAALRESHFAAFSLVFVSPDSSWVLSHDPGRPPIITPIASGWHVITHMDLDDPDEPRTAWLVQELSVWRPTSLDEATRGMIERLRWHGEAATTTPDSLPQPPVCIHEGRMVTVSSSIVALTRDQAHYRHAEGRPCVNEFTDLSGLLAGDLATAEPQ